MAVKFRRSESGGQKSAKIAVGGCYQYRSDNGGTYRIVVAGISGNVIFAHSVFTTGEMQEHAALQVFDKRYLDNLRRVKLGVPWKTYP